MIFSGDAGAAKVIVAGVEFNRIDLLFVAQPGFVIVTARRIRRRMVAPQERAVAVVGALLDRKSVV